jgi:formylglycine-generating enzyme required for sulfatase activity
MTGCRSRYGVFDLSGNASEWVADGSVMGGDVRATMGYASCTARAETGPFTGYRCCGDPAWE